MQTITRQNDSPEIIVWNNKVEDASRMLRMRVNNSKSFKEIRKPRKSIVLRQKKRLKRERQVRDNDFQMR